MELTLVDLPVVARLVVMVNQRGGAILTHCTLLFIESRPQTDHNV